MNFWPKIYYKYLDDKGGEGETSGRENWVAKLPKNKKLPGLNYMDASPSAQNIWDLHMTIASAALAEFMDKHPDIIDKTKTLYRGDSQASRLFRETIADVAFYTAKSLSPHVPLEHKEIASIEIHNATEILKNAYTFMYGGEQGNQFLDQTVRFINRYVKNYKGIDPNAHERN